MEVTCRLSSNIRNCLKNNKKLTQNRELKVLLADQVPVIPENLEYLLTIATSLQVEFMDYTEEQESLFRNIIMKKPHLLHKQP